MYQLKPGFLARVSDFKVIRIHEGAIVIAFGFELPLYANQPFARGVDTT